MPACRRPGSPISGGFSTAPLVDASTPNAHAPMNALTLNTKPMPPPRVPREDVGVLLVNEGSAIHRTLGDRVAQDLTEAEEIIDPSIGWAGVLFAKCERPDRGADKTIGDIGAEDRAVFVGLEHLPGLAVEK